MSTVVFDKTVSKWRKKHQNLQTTEGNTGWVLLKEERLYLAKEAGSHEEGTARLISLRKNNVSFANLTS